MTSCRLKALIVLTLMLGAAGSAIALRPSVKFSEPVRKIELESLIPKEFGEWSIDGSIVPVIPAPDLEEKMDKIYAETVTRTYVNADGERVMLSVAYGVDQTARLRVHRPESCYTGQGFYVKQFGNGYIKSAAGVIPVKRLVAQQGSRHEPITYWIRVGGFTVTGLIGQRLTQLRYGLTGEVPEGLIFRMSTVVDNARSAYAIHDQFAEDLMRVLPLGARSALVGNIPFGSGNARDIIR
ncbi:EpsI family protein [Aromatoleum tolulyticum]|uniref:EpsI family protein n=1 Tax=Aromatoleum tolulyticum TaxID=34027 RepID=A0A1N6PEY9_9RHOO|nr:exosortase-associated protein EpsI, B-type [Aromatoleum tolulyticum]SIQ02854.1 EpsI family protein [Aromatoleum tolulyticum]